MKGDLADTLVEIDLMILGLISVHSLTLAGKVGMRKCTAHASRAHPPSAAQCLEKEDRGVATPVIVRFLPQRRAGKSTLKVGPRPFKGFEALGDPESTYVHRMSTRQPSSPPHPGIAAAWQARCLSHERF